MRETTEEKRSARAEREFSASTQPLKTGESLRVESSNCGKSLQDFLFLCGNNVFIPAQKHGRLQR